MWILMTEFDSSVSVDTSCTVWRLYQIDLLCCFPKGLGVLSGVFELSYFNWGLPDQIQWDSLLRIKKMRVEENIEDARRRE